MITAAESSGTGENLPTLAEALEFAESRVAAGLPGAFEDHAELRNEARALLRFAVGLSDAQIYADPGRRLGNSAWARFREIVARRAAGEPFAYIEECRGFHAIDLHVGPSVLIPRPETEIIVDTVIALAPPASFSVVDLGTGSGAIALGIAHARPDASVVAVDISLAALAIAGSNAVRLGLTIECVESDWFERVQPQRFDFICCNPPYIRSDDPHLEQLHFEPRLALDGGTDGLREIGRMLADAPAYLAPGGTLLIEHGYDQAAAVAHIAADAGLRRLRTIRDLGDHERVSVFRGGDAG